METVGTWLLPTDLPVWLSAGLVLLAAVTSLITAAVGAGGGVILLAVLALAVPPAAIIPVHGMVQLGSNLNRALMLWRHIDLRTLAWFAPGVALGAWLASVLLVDLPLATIQLCIAAFILLLVWGPALPGRALGPAGILIASLTTSFISMFVGATGPLVAAFMKQQQTDRLRTVATFAGAMCLQHAPKALVYGAAGFAFRDWLGLILLMIAAGALGTRIGLHLLQGMSERRFGRLFDIVLTLLALRLLWEASG